MNKVLVFALLVCFFSGAIWGVGGMSFSGSELGVSIKDVLEMGSYCATIFVALIGAKTLTAWQSQFKHSEKYKAIKSFQNKLYGEQVGEVYLYSTMQQVMDSINQGAPMGLLDGVKFFQERSQAWVSHCFEMEQAWAEMTLFLSESEIKHFNITPRDVENNVSDARMIMLRYYEDGNNNAIEIYKVCRSASENLKENFRSLRTDTNSFIKLVLG
ncbi:hypothetical protein SOP86_18230 [Pseudomonas canadensis]|uniref:hypothetical protein n=1 Tax=Pseudomonas canadensis TaxID=915099 RepID=UPI002B251554|nr:hypothetical protein [Pseudomonas canadensis]MEB2647580.1 hypothetical protein [Pseudomonas canadensis]